MAPGMTEASRTTTGPHMYIEGLPEGSYAKAAKYLQTSGHTVVERLNVAEALLNTSVSLTPRPERLVLQHTIFALTCNKSDFDEFRARYWRLLHRVHEREPSLVVPATISKQAVKSLCKGGEERDACVRAIDVFLNSNVLRPNIETLGALAGAAVECTIANPDCDVSRNVALALLVEYNDLQQRNPSSKRVFGVCFTSLVFPVLRSTGVIRQAGEIVLRHGLFPNVEDVLNLQAYYDGLYEIFADVRAAPHPAQLPELLRFLMRACRDKCSVQRDKLVEFPAVGKKRAFSKIDAPSTKSVVAKQRGELPLDIAIPMRFLSDALESLMRNIDNEGAKCAHFLESVESLAATAAELRIYRPSYDEPLIEQSASQRSRIKDAGKKAKIPVKQTTVGGLMSKLLKFIASDLKRVANEKQPDVEEIVRLAKCSEAAIKLIMDSSTDDLPNLINSVCVCAGKVNDSTARNALASFFSELFRTYRSTRKIPNLFELFCSAGNDDCVLGELYNILAIDCLQEVIVDCLRSLPYRQADICVQHLLRSRWKEHPKAAVSVLFLLSLIVEVVELPTLKTILPMIAASVEPDIVSKGTDATYACGALFFYASVGLALAKNSMGPSSALGVLFSFEKVLGRTSGIAKQNETDITFVNCQLRFLAAWTQFMLIEYTWELNTALSKGRLLLTTVGKLSLRGVLDERKTSTSEEWAQLVLEPYSNGIVSLLRIFAGVCTVLDLFTNDDSSSAEDLLIEKGLHLLLSLTMIEADVNDVLWDSILETKFGRKLLVPVTLSLTQDVKVVCWNGGSVLKSMQKFLPLVVRNNETADLLRACEMLQEDKALDAKIQGSVKLVVEALSNSSENLDDDRGSLIDSLINRLSTVISVGKEQMMRKVKAREFSDDDKLVRVLKSLNSLISKDDKLMMKVLVEQREVMSLTAVVVCDKALYGPEIGRCTLLQTLCMLSQDRRNAGIMGIRKHLIKKLDGLDMEMKGDMRLQPYNLLDRLVSVGLAVTCGAVRVPTRFEWMEPRGGIIQAIERASRFLGTSEPNEDDIILAAVSIRAIASTLWQTRQNNQGVICGNNARNRGVAFKADVERGSRITRIWNTAEYAVATCSLIAQNAGIGVEQGETLLNALSELMFVDGAIDEMKKEQVRTRLYYGLVRAVCLIGRKTNLTLSALRCIRAALRSGCVDERCGRTISRYFEKVSGPPVVSALVDLAVALVDVDNPRVRAAMEPGAASLIRQLDERGRNEALRACNDNGRDVLRSLVETYRQDFEYGRN